MAFSATFLALVPSRMMIMTLGSHVANASGVVSATFSRLTHARCASAVLLQAQPDLPRSWSQAPAPPMDLQSNEDVEFMPRDMRQSMPPGFHWSFEVRMGKDEHGPAAWITTPLQLTREEPMSPLERCAAVADLTFGLSGRTLLRQRKVDVGAWRVPMINIDTTIYWERPPVGEWFGFRHALLTDRDGVGLAEADLADRDGRLGRSLQALVSNG